MFLTKAAVFLHDPASPTSWSAPVRKDLRAFRFQHFSFTAPLIFLPSGLATGSSNGRPPPKQFPGAV